MPLDGLMTLGYDVCHDRKNERFSWGALVATMDLKKGNTEFFSTFNRHINDTEMTSNLAVNIRKAIYQFMKINRCLPARILLYRDGLNDNQILHVVESEVRIIKQVLKELYKNHGHEDEVPFIYIVVKKRINTRVFSNDSYSRIADDANLQYFPEQ